MVILVTVPFIGSNLVQASVASSNVRTSSLVVKIYSDSGCKNPVSSLNWGSLDVGSNKSLVLYVRNEGKTNTRLALTVTNWSPADASNYMKITWNYSNRNLNPWSTVKLALTLATAQNTPALASFKCDVIFIATG